MALSHRIVSEAATWIVRNRRGATFVGGSMAPSQPSLTRHLLWAPNRGSPFVRDLLVAKSMALSQREGRGGRRNIERTV